MAHEWGHFITAKKFGVKVNEFAVGMGPKIFHVKKGETLYSLRAFPIGGFCALQGEESIEESKYNDKDNIDPKRSFKNKPAWQKAIIMIAGITINFFVGIILSIILTFFGGDIQSNVISEISGNYSDFSNSETLKEGDEIVAINNYKIHVSRDIKYAIRVSDSNDFDIDVIRNGQLVKIRTSLVTEIPNEGSFMKINFATIDKNLFNVVRYAVADVMSILYSSINSTVRLITGRLSMKNLSGPIGIASNVGKIASNDSCGDALFKITSMMMAISIGLSVFNGFPIPALDGGRVLLLIPEIFTGKPVSDKIEMVINSVGLVLILLLTVLIAYNDIRSWGT